MTKDSICDMTVDEATALRAERGGLAFCLMLLGEAAIPLAVLELVKVGRHPKARIIVRLRFTFEINN